VFLVVNDLDTDCEPTLIARNSHRTYLISSKISKGVCLSLRTRRNNMSAESLRRLNRDHADIPPSTVHQDVVSFLYLCLFEHAQSSLAETAQSGDFRKANVSRFDNDAVSRDSDLVCHGPLTGEKMSVRGHRSKYCCPWDQLSWTIWSGIHDNSGEIELRDGVASEYLRNLAH
jgi:hypothetical protein